MTTPSRTRIQTWEERLRRARGFLHSPLEASAWAQDVLDEVAAAVASQEPGTALQALQVLQCVAETDLAAHHARLAEQNQADHARMGRHHDAERAALVAPLRK